MLNLNAGVNGVLIKHIRNQGGSAVVHLTELSRKNGFCQPAACVALKRLEEKGLVAVARDGGLRESPRITLNEEAIRAHEASGSDRGTERTPRVKRESNEKTATHLPAVKQATADIAFLQNHPFGESTKPVVEELLAVAEKLVSKYVSLERTLQQKQDENAKLCEAVRGLDADEKELVRITSVTPEELAERMDYDDPPTTVPTIDFAKLLAEPSKVFKPLARLQQASKVVRNMGVDVRRKTTEQDIIREKLNDLLADLQNVETVDVTADLQEWRRKGDEVLNRAVAKATAVVSTRE